VEFSRWFTTNKFLISCYSLVFRLFLLFDCLVYIYFIFFTL